jgi:hypothetical protein
LSFIEQFPSRAPDIEDVPSPFREALLAHVQPEETVQHLIFSPAFATQKFRTRASVFCVTDRRWLIVLKEEDGSATIDQASFEETLIVELTIILLYGQIKIGFVKDCAAQSIALQFNTVMNHLYLDAIQDLLDGIDGNRAVGEALEKKSSPILKEWVLKFRNVALLYSPRGSKLVDGVYWHEIRGGFGRELAPAAALLLTDRHIIYITEEKTSSWFRSKNDSKYGEIITYFPLNRLAKSQFDVHARFNILQVEGFQVHGGEKLEMIVPLDKREAISRLMQKASALS